MMGREMCSHTFREVWGAGQGTPPMGPIGPCGFFVFFLAPTPPMGPDWGPAVVFLDLGTPCLSKNGTDRRAAGPRAGRPAPGRPGPLTPGGRGGSFFFYPLLKGKLSQNFFGASPEDAARIPETR